MNHAFSTYLRDHLAGAQFAIAMLERLRDSYPDGSQRHFAASLLRAIEDDRVILQKLADDFSDDQSAFKETVAWLAEKASRVKLRLGSGDPLALFEALETLSLGVLGKLKLWEVLAAISDRHPRLQEIDFESLAARAQSQHEELEARRIATACKLFTA